MGTEPTIAEGFAALLGHPIPRIDILDIGAMLEEGGDRCAQGGTRHGI